MLNGCLKDDEWVCDVVTNTREAWDYLYICIYHIFDVWDQHGKWVLLLLTYMQHRLEGSLLFAPLRVGVHHTQEMTQIETLSISSNQALNIRPIHRRYLSEHLQTKIPFYYSTKLLIITDGFTDITCNYFWEPLFDIWQKNVDEYFICKIKFRDIYITANIVLKCPVFKFMLI